MVNHDIVWFDIAMHYPHAVGIIQSFQQLVQVVADVIICQVLIQLLGGNGTEHHNRGVSVC